MNYLYKDAYSERGLFAYFWCVVDALSNLNDDDELYVDLKKTTPYFDPNYSQTDNVWEYYFEQMSDSLNRYDVIYEFNSDKISNLKFGIENGKYVLQYDRDRIALAKKLIKKYIRFKSHILDKKKKFVDEFFAGNTILGVHVRAGDHFTVGHGRNFKLTNEFYFNQIDELLHNYDKLFLITNNMDIRVKFIEKYGNKLVYYDNKFLSLSGVDITWEHRDNNYQKGEGAVLDCLLFSECNMLLATASNLGCLSVMLTENEYKYIDEHVRYI